MDELEELKDRLQETFEGKPKESYSPKDEDLKSLYETIMLLVREIIE